MASIEFTNIFSGIKAEIALFSTYDFDPLFFEQRILTSKALSEAKRIAVFMDWYCYCKLGRSENYARYINSRYLVIPVKTKAGVFHPKLHILIQKDCGRIICGSNNLTQSGSIHNLELFNYVDVGGELQPDNRLALQTLEFFRNSSKQSDTREAALSSKWLDDINIDYPWTNDTHENKEQEIQLIDSFSSSPLKWLENNIKNEKVEKLVIVSPFYDSDLRLFEHIYAFLPEVDIEIYAQQKSSSLPANVLHEKFPCIKLYDVSSIPNRRLHAKLVLVKLENRTLCLSGSANFTNAAFNGINTECCLGFDVQGEMDIFSDDIFSVSKIDACDFQPGDIEEPKAPTEENGGLVISGAAIQDQQLVFDFYVRNELKFDELTVSLKKVGEEHPVLSRKIDVSKRNSTYKFKCEEGLLKELKGTVSCYLRGKSGGEIYQSPSCWLIQEANLTYVHSGVSRHNEREKIIQESGNGLVEYLDRLGDNGGQEAIIDFLNHLKIRFSDEKNLIGATKGFPVNIKDPTISGDMPSWMHSLAENSDFEKVVYDFVDRHHKENLNHHAIRGNLNGLENFVDVFLITNKLLYTYQTRGFLKKFKTMLRYRKSLAILTQGGTFVESEQTYDGFLLKIFAAHSGDMETITDLLIKYRLVEHAALALIMAQLINQSIRKRPLGDCLPQDAENLQWLCKATNINPNKERFCEILPLYNIDNEKQWENYFEEQKFT